MTIERIEANMSPQEVLITMGEGFPGAIAVCMELLKHGEQIDPDAELGGLSFLPLLDSLNIRGWRLYALWKDVCNKDVRNMMAVLRAYNLGRLAGIDEKTLQHAIDNQGEGIDLDTVMSAVQERLPKFNR